MKAVPHLNELQAKFGESGLLVVGVSNEAAEKITGAIESAGMEFPVAGTAKDVIGAYGVRGIPATFLIDRSGELVWRGHPNEVRDAQLEALLQ